MAIGEAGISFYSAGGHDHDGINSSRIDSRKYSVWDWEWDPITDSVPSRLIRQFENYQKFETAILNVINQNILSPAGVQLLPNSLHGVSIISETITATQIAANTITADEILAGTITGDLFNANVVLVNQVIASNNYVAGVSGWAIAGNGDAEFANTAIRGTITAGAVNIGAEDFWNSDGSFMLGGNTGIYTSSGIVRIGTDVLIEGTILADEIQVDEDNRWNANGFVLGGDTGIYTTANGIVLGDDVEIQGYVEAGAIYIDDDNQWGANGFILGGNSGIYTTNTGVAIGNWLVSNSKLIGSNNDNTTIILDPEGNGSIYTLAAENSGDYLMITNGDVFADDITGIGRVRSGSPGNNNTHTEMQFPGVFYTFAAQGVYGRNNYGWSFTYDGTNAWAHLWDPSLNNNNGGYISVCLATCAQVGATTSSTTTIPPTTTTPAPGSTTTTTTTTSAPTTTPPPGIDCSFSCNNTAGWTAAGVVNGQQRYIKTGCADQYCPLNTTTPAPTTTTTTTTTTSPPCGQFACGAGFCDSCEGCICSGGICMCP